MIDIENAKKVFNEYVKNFNPEDGRIKLKIDHILRVANYSKQIATNLKLSEEQIQLAELIGIFHDIGRFKQVEKYHTFSDRDSGVNHSEYSIKVLYEDNLIEKFKVDDKYNHIIKKAVLNHNKSEIETGLNEDELLFAKIIRDADKLDIITHAITEYDFESVFWYSEFNCEEINEELIKIMFENHTLDYSKIKNNADLILSFYNMIYDLNFKSSLKELSDNKALNIFTNRIYENFNSEKVKEQTKKVFEYTQNYLNQNI
jgi:hypothetical protein